jgi:hypothetical protein
MDPVWSIDRFPQARRRSSQQTTDMHNMMAAPSVNVGEDRNAMDPVNTMDHPIEQIARTSEKSAGGFAQGPPGVQEGLAAKE